MYIFEINPLSVASFTIIFSHSEGCLFTLLIVPFVAQKLLSFIRSHLFIFAFISNTHEHCSDRQTDTWCPHPQPSPACCGSLGPSVIAWDSRLFSSAALRIPAVWDVVAILAGALAVCDSDCSE